MQTLHSTVTSVTVFPSIASVTRTAVVSLPIGESLVAFQQLPETLSEKSIQLTGTGNATMGNIKIEKVYYAEETNVNKNDLLNQYLFVEDDLRNQDDKIQRFNKEIGFIDAIIQKITAPNEEGQAELEPDKWKKMLSFQQEKLESIQLNIRAAEKEKKKNLELLEKLKSDLEKLGNPNTKKMKYRISVSLKLDAPSEIILELSYHVPGAQWYPVYDIRITSDKKMNLAYQAMISQNSGEDWEEASLRISTARPKVHSNQPELHPWYVDYNMEDYEAPMATRMANRPVGAGASAAAQAPLLKKPPVTVETGASSVAFVISGKNTVKSDGSETKVTILMEDFNPYFNYSTVPVLQPYAYLKAKIKNHTELPLLAGEANVFLDGNFISISKIKTIAPTEEFIVSLGIDEGFKIERQEIKQFEKEGGNLFSKKTTLILYEYLITVKNFKQTTEEISVLDQFPISTKETIKVQLVDPIIKENSDVLKKDELNFLEWSLKLKPGEETKIMFKYTIEFPQEIRDKIVGINF